MTEGTRTEAGDSAATTTTAPEPTAAEAKRTHGSRPTALERLRAAEALLLARKRDGLLTYRKLISSGGDTSGFQSGEVEEMLADINVTRAQLGNDIEVARQVREAQAELQVIESGDVARNAALEAALAPWRLAVENYQRSPGPENEQACRRLHIPVAAAHTQIERAGQCIGDLRQRIEALRKQAPMIFPDDDVVVIRLPVP